MGVWPKSTGEVKIASAVRADSSNRRRAYHDTKALREEIMTEAKGKPKLADVLAYYRRQSR